MLGSGDSSYIIKLRGLPFTTTVEDVLDFLNGVNVCNGKEGVHLTEVRPGRPSGECFVEVESQQDVEEALKKDKDNMGKRYIEVFSTDRTDMEWAIRSTGQADNGGGFDGPMQNVSDDMGIVKLRGLPFGCNKEEVVQFFDGLMIATDGVHLLSDVTGRASGEAFVHFVDKESAQEALSRDREKIGHRYIEVFLSSADEVRAYLARIESGYRSSRGYRPTPYDRNDRFSGRFGSRGRGSFGGGYGGGGGRGGFRRGTGLHCVHMRGLPFKASPQDIAYFFKPIRPLDINILYDSTGRPSGEADVEFECHEDAMRAMRRDKNNMDHRYIELFLNSSPGGGGGGFKPNRSFRNSY